MPYMNSHNVQQLVNRYSDMILRISFMQLKSTDDAEDICQDVFMKLLTGDFQFESEVHEKAWIIRTTINACRDHMRTSFWKRATVLDEAYGIHATMQQDSELLEIIMTLPKNYRTSIYLHYYEGYSVNEIGTMLNKPANTISAYLSRGRKKLRPLLEDAYDLQCSSLERS